MCVSFVWPIRNRDIVTCSLLGFLKPHFRCPILGIDHNFNSMGNNRTLETIAGYDQITQYISSSSSSCRVINTDISDPLSSPLPIVHSLWQVLLAISSISAELLYVGSSRTSCICSSLWRGPQEYITYELVSTSPTVSRMSNSKNFDSFRDGW